MLLNIDKIKVKKRVRHEPGDLESLKDSMRRFGLMNPITVNSKYELIAGERRLAAAKQLGWTSINAQIIEVNDKLTQLEMELEENNQRKPFTDEELLEGYALLEKLRNPSFFAKIWTKIKMVCQNLFVIDKGKNSKKSIAHSRKMSIFAFIGLIVVIVASFLHKKEFITTVMHVILDIIGGGAILFGTFYLIRAIVNQKRR
ncbi:MAG: ParB N-terminal domain-containing protein [Treponema sp.]|nr:ParB N-terminal domain-containing protein [Treponema sp.]